MSPARKDNDCEGETGTRPAVLVLAFRRAEILRQTLAAVCLAKPRAIYISVDGPRATISSDIEDGAQVRDVVEGLDWDGPLATRYCTTNLGLGEGVSQAVGWFLNQEQSGVVLEDDVCIEPASLELAGLLLAKYQGDKSVGSISLFSAVPEGRLRESNATYRFSQVPSSQYWGTWRDRWAAVTPLTAEWREKVPESVMVGIGGKRFSRVFARNLDHDLRTGNDSWEGRWILTHWTRRWRVVTTNDNFSVHLGFNELATNSSEQPSWYPTSAHSWDGTVVEPFDSRIDGLADRWLLNQRFGLSFSKRFKRRVKRWFPGLAVVWRSHTVKSVRPPVRVDGQR